MADFDIDHGRPDRLRRPHDYLGIGIERGGLGRIDRRTKWLAADK
jgi:hypothetical protein